jgi:hypothetical protein
VKRKRAIGRSGQVETVIYIERPVELRKLEQAQEDTMAFLSAEALGLDVEMEELEVRVTGHYTPADPGCVTGPSDRWCPPSGADIEDVEAFFNGAAFELSEAERSKAEDALLDTATDEDVYDPPEPDYDDRWDE